MQQTKRESKCNSSLEDMGNFNIEEQEKAIETLFEASHPLSHLNFQIMCSMNIIQK